jgi:hypothetical protein
MTVNEVKDIIDYLSFVVISRVIILYCLHEIWKVALIIIGQKLGILRSKING